MGDRTHDTKAKAARALCVGLIAVLAGCASSKPVETTKAETAPVPVVTVTKDNTPTPRDTAPRRTGTYPTFAKPLTAANVQMSDNEASTIEGKMKALAAEKHAGNVSEAEYKRRIEELRKLAQQHGQETLSEIAN